MWKGEAARDKGTPKSSIQIPTRHQTPNFNAEESGPLHPSTAVLSHSSLEIAVGPGGFMIAGSNMR
jgi:hypothetical protein